MFHSTSETQYRIEAEQLYQMAEEQIAAGNLEAAISLCQQSLVLEKRIGNLNGQPQILALLAQLFSLKGEYQKALQHLQQAVEIVRQQKCWDTAQLEEIMVEVIVSRWHKLRATPGEKMTEEKLVEWMEPLDRDTFNSVLCRLEKATE
jgi:tetratricopeptide (TPR) repeat protein